jgi:hypothetical protein
MAALSDAAQSRVLWPLNKSTKFVFPVTWHVWARGSGRSDHFAMRHEYYAIDKMGWLNMSLIFCLERNVTRFVGFLVCQTL